MFEVEEYTVREHKRGKNRVQKVINVSAKSKLEGDDEVIVLKKSEWEQIQDEWQNMGNDLQGMEDMKAEFEVLKSQQSEIENSMYKQTMMQKEVEHLEQLLEFITPQLEQLQHEIGEMKIENKKLHDENTVLNKENAGVESIVSYYAGVIEYLRRRNIWDRLLNNDISQTTEKPRALQDWEEKHVK